MTGPTPSHSRRVPLEKRKRTETSCDKCKSRKQKCRREADQDACRYCAVHNIECLTTQPRKKRLYGSVEGLSHRLALLESLVKGLMPEADVASLDELRRLGSELGIPLPDHHQTASDEATGETSDAEEPLSMLPDQQGQAQYIGPASSFAFHLKLRSLVGQERINEFVLFGRNAAFDHGPLDGDARHHALSTPTASSTQNQTEPADPRAPAGDSPTLEALVTAYFDHINDDFPVLHEASFRETYDQWVAEPSHADPAWLCGFLCVLLLARRVAPITLPDDQDRSWWRRVQSLLPVVIFTSSVSAVQGLLLAAIYLHNTNHRDACWSLTGTALRIAVAIGLHQDKVNTMQPPLTRELRRRLWWTLYAFEQMQVSSYDRPSAVEHPAFKVACPNDRVLGMAARCPPEYSPWFSRLSVLLASACRAPKTTTANPSDESYLGPLSPAAGVLRELDRWKETLPVHLRYEAVAAAPASFQRPLLLLHAKFHYTVLVLCRCALLIRATKVMKEGKDSDDTALTSMADSAASSGRALAQILLKLDSLNKFDAITWWDIWYGLTSAHMLVLDLVCTVKLQGGADASSSTPPKPRQLLSQLAHLTNKHRRNPHMPGTIEKWASIVPELASMADAVLHPLPPATKTKAEPPSDFPSSISKAATHETQANPASSPTIPSASAVARANELYGYQLHPSTNSGAYLFADNVPAVARMFSDAAYPPSSTFPNVRFDRGTQMSFMDFTTNNMHDWIWPDVGTLLGSGEVGPQGGP